LHSRGNQSGKPYNRGKPKEKKAVKNLKQKGKSGEMGNPRRFCENLYLEIEAKNVKSKEEGSLTHYHTQLSFLFVLQRFA